MKPLQKLSRYLTVIALMSLLFACEKDPNDIDDPDNSTFSVTLITPESDAEYTVGDVISVSATIVDEEGIVESVDFYFDDVMLESVSESPYSISLNTIDYDEGNHSIKAEALSIDGVTKDNSINISLIKGDALEIDYAGATITEDETWEGNKIYKLRENTKISATVTIEPGCIVKVNGYIKTLEGGKIIANGTADNPIIFTSTYTNIGGDNSNPIPEQRDWDYISLASTGNIFNNCIFEYGDETIVDYYNDLSYTFTNCTFRYGYNGLKLSRIPAADSKIENCRFYSNHIPMSISAYVNIGNTNHFTNEDGTLQNDLQHISLMVIGLTSGVVEVKQDVTLTETSIAYSTYFFIRIINNSTFTLKEGVVLKMGSMGATDIDYEDGCEFIMEKDSYVTSYNDNTLLGDPNSTDVPTNEDWLGISKDGTYIENMDNVLYSKYSSK